MNEKNNVVVALLVLLIVIGLYSGFIGYYNTTVYVTGHKICLDSSCFYTNKEIRVINNGVSTCAEADEEFYLCGDFTIKY